MFRPVEPDKVDLAEKIPEKEPERQTYFIAALKKLTDEWKDSHHREPRFFCLTVGCQMNAKDSEKLAGILLSAGYCETGQENDADLIIYNTCSVRENADQKIYGRLGRLQNLKKNNPDLLIALCGCMMQEPHVVDTIKEKYSFVDIIFGTHNIYRLAELLCRRIKEGKPVTELLSDAGQSVEELPAERKYSFKSGVNIMTGCNNFCSYCIVPYVRGREKSREPEDIVREVEELVADGVKEVMLLGQNVNSYGKTLSNPVSFSELLQRVCDIPGLSRVRFMTSHPKDLSDDLIRVMADNEKICRHLHLPLQSGSSRVLKEMNRHYTKEQYLALVDKIRDAIPDIALTTDIIVGFPGETEEDFEETLDVVRKVRYESAFTFLYSPRVGTPAAEREDQIPKSVAQPRFDRLLSLVQQIAGEVCEEGCGRVEMALVESVDSHSEGYVTGRLSNNLMVHFPGDESLIGQIVPVSLLCSKGFYYMGEMVKEEGMNKC